MTQTRRLLTLSLLTAMSLTLYLLEAQLAFPTGIKPGLANLTTLFLLTEFSAKDAACVLLIRIFLGNLLTGQMVSFSYSLAGGICSLLVMWFGIRILKGKSIWFVSIMGGIAHNAGQLFVAWVYLKSGGVLYYVPYLLTGGICMGLLTGVVTQLFLKAWRR